MGIQTAVEMARLINDREVPEESSSFYDVYSFSPTGKERCVAVEINTDSPEGAIEIAKEALALKPHYDYSRFSFKVRPSFVVNLNYKKLCWALPVEKVPMAGFWSERENWVALAESLGMDTFFHISPRQNEHTGDFWVSQELMQALVARNYQEI
jgi:hypothetical protein